MVAVLVDEGKLDWTTQLQDIIPQFRRPEGDPTNNNTIADLLSHRTGLPSYDALWLLSDNKIPLDRADAVRILGYVPVAVPLRTEFVYNNMAYEVLGQVIEKASGTRYFSFLRNRILDPLGMTRTFYTNALINVENTAKPYATLESVTAFQLPPPLYGNHVMMGPAGGVRSSVHDLLILYNAFIDAAKSQVEHRESRVPHNPLKQLAHIWRGMISLPVSTVRENSYASGWVRVQLPAPMEYGSSPGIDPMLGEGLPSRLGLFHEGNIPGFASFAAIFPETSSAVVVLSNSVALTNGVGLVGQLLIEELFGNTINATDYTQYAQSTAKRGASTMSTIKKELIEGKTTDKPAHSLETYVGKYYNSIGNFFIDIREGDSNLRVYFMGLDSDGFDLEPYQHDSFFLAHVP
jgi:CubicO group peptidase (beta-lactamase class C family)